MDAKQKYLLAVNTGSSSIKVKLFRKGAALSQVWSGGIIMIGSPQSHFTVTANDRKILVDKGGKYHDHKSAALELARWILKTADPFTAVGYRVVHGGKRYLRPEAIDDTFPKYLKTILPLAPAHIPDEIYVIETFMNLFPAPRHIACFDTFFHRNLPNHAKYYPLPGNLRREGVFKYGFHGLSYEYILQYQRRHSPDEAKGKMIIAHLGNGSSLAAVSHGRSIDTTMGMTPGGGVMMGSRCGDIDPGILFYLLAEKKMTIHDLEDTLNHRSGLKGVSGISADAARLLQIAGKNRHAAEALKMYGYQVKKSISALAASLGGLDSLVFTGGIGENAPAVRQEICEGLQYLGVEIGAGNMHGSELISSPGSKANIRVIKTDEEYMIAWHMLHFI